jgi:hypothetical protein
MSALQAAAQTGSYKLALQLARHLHDAQGRIVARAVRLAVVCCMQRSQWAEVSSSLEVTAICQLVLAQTVLVASWWRTCAAVAPLALLR